jgi:hypothetical protein
MLGYNSFLKFYSKIIFKNFKNYYAIANRGKINSKHYEKFLGKFDLKYKKLFRKILGLKIIILKRYIKSKKPSTLGIC